MRLVNSLLIMLFSTSLILSGCLQEYNEINIINVDVMSISQEEGTELKITTYIKNFQDTDSGTLSVSTKIRDPSTNMIISRVDTDIGYIKSGSQTSSIVSLSVTDPGNYLVEIQLFEDGKMLDQYNSPVTVAAEPGAEADILLTDMTLVVKQFVDGVSKVALDVSPGIINQGGDSDPLIMEISANVDPYTHYTERDDLGIVRGSTSVRGNVQMILPKNTEYTFTVKVIENGKTVFTGNTVEKIKLNEIRFNTPVTYDLVEEGIPPTPTSTPTPGFGGLISLLGILLVYGLLNRTKGRSDE